MELIQCLRDQKGDGSMKRENGCVLRSRGKVDRDQESWCGRAKDRVGDGVFFSGRRGPRGGLSMVYSWTVNTAV